MGIFLLILRYIEALLLYGFVFAIFFYLWKFFSIQTTSKSSETDLLLTVGILDGNQQILGLKEFQKDRIKIGRGNQCDLILDDPSVSGRHATIRFGDGQWWIEDEGSRNGTYLNENRLLTPTILVNDDLIRFGDQKIKIIY